MKELRGGGGGEKGNWELVENECRSQMGIFISAQEFLISNFFFVVVKFVFTKLMKPKLYQQANMFPFPHLVLLFLTPHFLCFAATPQPRNGCLFGNGAGE